MQDEFMRLQAKLQKTIVFITHDFDEAIRLADRIAIMKDGAIIQVATPEELVLNPADSYVSEFTRFIPREKVTTIASIMTGIAGGSKDSHTFTISSSSKVAEVARTILDIGKPVPVVDEQAKLVGHVDRQQVLDVLVAGLPE